MLRSCLCAAALLLAFVHLPGNEPARAEDPTPKAEVLFAEDFDAAGVKAGLSALAAPLTWQVVCPNEPGKNLVGDISVGAGKYGWPGNYLDGATAAAAEAENVVRHVFSAAGDGQVRLTCKAFAPDAASAGSQISLRPAQQRYSTRAAGWICTAQGWDFFVGRVTSSRWPLGEEKPGPYQILRDALAGAHGVTVNLTVVVDLERNQAWGEARWSDAAGQSHEFKSAMLAWDSAAGNVASVLISSDRRHGHVGIALDDLRVEGRRPIAKPHPFGCREHVVQRLNGTGPAQSLPAELQWISKPWRGENAQVPYLAYLPEKDRVLMLLACGKDPIGSALIESVDHGKTWSDRRWLSVDQAGRPNAFALALTNLGGGRLLAFAEALNRPLWQSADYGRTWQRSAAPSMKAEMYAWDPFLVVKKPTGEVAQLAQGCWKPTGIPWGSAEAPYSQGYFRSSAGAGRTWTEPVKVPQWLGVNEISMLAARNGDWVAACRTDSPKRFAHNAFDHYSGLGVSLSHDQGKTWSKLNMLYEWGRHHPSMVLLPDGRILMTYVVRLGYPDAADGYPRFGVEAVISGDNGHTWDLDHRYILAEWTGNIRGEDGWYCGVQSTSTVLLPEGTLLTAFGAGFRNMPGATTCIMDVALLRWRL